MEKYYLVKGPTKFEDNLICKWWLESCHWAKDTIVVYAEKQDATLPGMLFRVIYKPPVAPDFKYLRMPEDWVIEIPCFKYVAYAEEEQWKLQKSNDGKIMVVRR